MGNTLSFLTPIISAIIGGFFAYFISRLNNKFKKFTSAKEALETMLKTDTESKKDFIYTNFEETNFYAQTGIKTNAKHIPKFVDLYNKLDIHWSTICKAQYRLNLEGKEIDVNLKKSQIRIKEIVLISALLILILGVGATFFANEITKDKLQSVIFSLTVTIASVTFGYLMVSAIESTNSAHIIQKKLNRLKTKESTQKETESKE